MEIVKELLKALLIGGITLALGIVLLLGIIILVELFPTFMLWFAIVLVLIALSLAIGIAIMSEI